MKMRRFVLNLLPQTVNSHEVKAGCAISTYPIFMAATLCLTQGTNMKKEFDPSMVVQQTGSSIMSLPANDKLNAKSHCLAR